MANQILKKFIKDKQIDQDKILLDNDGALKSLDSTGLIEKDLIKLDGDDKVVITDVKDPASDYDAATKKYVDDAVIAVAGDFVEDAGDTMFGSLVIDGSTAPLPQAANLEVKDHLDNTKSATLSAYSLSGNESFGVSGATELLLDAGGGTADITMTGAAVHVSTPTIDLNGDVDIENYLIRPDNSAGTPFIQFPPIGEKVFVSGGTGDINLSTPTGKTVFGDSGSIVDCLYVDPTTNRLAKVSSVEGTGLIPSYLTLDGGAPDASLVSPNGDVNINAISGEVNLNAMAVDVNAPMYIDQNKIALDQISGYELYFDNTSPDAGTYLKGMNVIIDSSTGGNITLRASASSEPITIQMESIYNVNTISGNTTMGSGDGSIQFMLNAVNIDANGAMGTINMTSQVDMDGKKIVDVQQLENLSAGTMSGNTLRWDELGAYSVSAGYGIATLGADGKILAEQLPAAVMEYKGTWDASTNTPTLANGNPPNAPEDAGHLYKVSVGGTVDFGAGNITFNAGDTVILSASLIWEKSSDANLVTSVNGAQGVVVLDAEDLIYLQGNASDWTVADNSSIKLTLDEVGSRLTSNENDISALEDDVGHLVTLSGVAVDSDNLGSFTGSTIADNQTVKAAIQDLETAHEEVDQNANDLITLSGVAENSINLGSFTGITISDNQTVKAALQDLETAHEAHLNDSADAHDASAISLSPAINGQSDVQSAMGDHETRIDALEAVTPEIFKKTLIAGDITNKYIDLPYLAVQTKEMAVFADRLAIHQDLSWISGDTTPDGDDFRVSVASGVTRISFLNDLVGAGNQKLAVGDTIYVRYKRSV